MSFPRDAYPYTNFHELNLGYFITHFREIFSQWADLYDQMTDWKDATDEELATWKTGVEADLDQREAALRAELETWKAQTGQDIAGWEDATLAALTAWQTATQAVFEAIRVEAAGSATAAAASAGDAATAKTAAETAQAAAEAAAASVQTSAAQIATNTADIADLKTQLDNITNKKIYQPEVYNIRVFQGKIAENNSSRSIVIPVTTGKHYKIEAIGTGNRNRVFGIAGSSWDIGTDATDLEYTPEITTITTNITIEIDPVGYNYLAITFAYSTATPFAYEFIPKVTETASAEQFSVNGIEVPTFEQFENTTQKANDALTAIGYKEMELLEAYSNGSYWSVESAIAEKKSAGTYIAYDPVEIENEKQYTAYVYQGTSTKQDPVIIVDENYNILNRYRGTNSQYNTFQIRIDNPIAKYVLITGYSASHPCSLKMTELNNIQEIIENVTNQENAINKLYKKDITNAKYLSILGDSISALQGTIPEGNLAYYTANRNYGVETPADIWWGIVANTLGMSVLVNNSWSGSRVCDPNYAEGDAIPASYPARCQALDDGTHDPDYVIIAMGVNDYSYNSLLGEWDGKTMPVDDVDFTQSYALMINRINSEYPNAKIFCLSPWFVQRGQDKGINYANSQAAHLTESKYGDAIRKLCEMLGAIYIDSYVGFNRYNYYPTYCEDSAETPTHPNKAGQAVMGKVIAEKIRTLIF